MDRIRPKITVFGWPSHLGGADTKLAHLLELLHKDLEFTVVPNEKRHLDGPFWPTFLKNLGIRSCLFDQLPRRLEGFALALSNQCFFTHHICHRAKDRGLKVAWSSEMMWHHEGELDAVRDGLIDRVLYTSRIQKDLLSPNYGKIPGFITGNYIDPVQFPFAERLRAGFTIGRLSRPAPEKYPEDFPVFYECLELPECRFRVMAWDEKLSSKYRWHRFDHRWDLLAAETEDTAQFLNSLTYSCIRWDTFSRNPGGVPLLKRCSPGQSHLFLQATIWTNLSSMARQAIFATTFENTKSGPTNYSSIIRPARRWQGNAATTP